MFEKDHYCCGMGQVCRNVTHYTFLPTVIRQCESLCAHFPAANHHTSTMGLSISQPFLLPQVHSAICYFRNEKETGAEMRAEIVSGIVTGDAPFSYWSMFLPDPSNSPRILRES